MKFQFTPTTNGVTCIPLKSEFTCTHCGTGFDSDTEYSKHVIEEHYMTHSSTFWESVGSAETDVMLCPELAVPTT